ncbi:MAG: peptidyl-prolyl cis-trans isomerase, partial [Ignavibacterium sp.]|nr:peptidyl-prolyl cis-trans isomerase [Ignavibacterium sp.]
KKGVPFDSLYTELNPQNDDTLTISVGQLAENIEDKIFPLPDDAFTTPIEMNGSWYIFKILKRYNSIISKSLGWENDFKKSQKIAKERAERVFYKSYMENFFKNKQVKINGKLLKSFSTHLFTVLKSRAADNQKPEKLYLMSVDIPLIEYQLGKDTLTLPFVEMSDRIINAEDFLNYLRFENFYVDSLDYHTILKSLNNKTKDFIEYKMLANEGYRQGLQNNSDVKNQVKMWKENYFMQLVTTKFIDSSKVSDQEIIDFYNVQKNGKLRNKQVNILQFYSDSLETVEKFLNEIENGKSFEDLLKKYSSNQLSEINSGESGFISVNSNREVGRIAASMKIDDIYGPMSFKNGYLVFKLIDVKEDSVFLSKAFSDIKNELGRELGYLKQKKSLNKFIGDLANKYGLQVNLDNLKNITVTSHQSIIYRYLGFGGRILAVPLVNINMEWVPEWQGRSQNIQ